MNSPRADASALGGDLASTSAEQDAAQADWREEYGQRVRQLIEKNKRYPVMARRSGLEGVVELDFRIARDGHLVAVQVNHSSGHAALDQAAIQAVQGVNQYPPWPENSPDPDLQLKLSIAFRLSKM